MISLGSTKIFNNKLIKNYRNFNNKIFWPLKWIASGDQWEGFETNINHLLIWSN